MTKAVVSAGPAAMEYAVFVAAAVLALLPFRSNQPWRWRTLVAITGCAAALLGWLWRMRSEAVQAVQDERAAHAPLSGRDGFASSDTCRACHPGAYASWHASYHRTMTQPASADSIRAPFDGRSVVMAGHDYRFARQGDAFAVEIDGARREVALVTGSHHQQRYWLRSEAGRSLDLLPLDFLLTDGRWVPGPSVFVLPPGVDETGTGGLWNRNCITCHDVAGQPGLDEAKVFSATRVAELGIACEACHGPAAAHVARYQDPVYRYAAHVAARDDAAQIVNPEHLSRRAASAVCGQCHAVFVFKQHERREGSSYRAGGVLDDDRYLVHGGSAALDGAGENPPLPPGFLAQRFWSDGEVRVSGREYSGLVASECYRRGDLSCLDCHSMHASAPDDQLRPDRVGDAACVPCHAAERYGSGHTHHASASEGSRCANCHMPYTTFGLLKSIRTHRISSPSVAVNMTTGRPNACNLCHLDRTLAWTAEHLSSWYGAEPVNLSPEERRVAAALLWLLRGDAGQRALAAASMGLASAQSAAGTAWMPPYLAGLLDDPYSAVRYNAARALHGLAGYSDLAYDWVGSPAEWQQAQREAIGRWRRSAGAAVSRAELLLPAPGRIDVDAVVALQRERDDRPVMLSE